MSRKKRRYELKESIGKGGMGEVFRGVSQGAYGFRARVAIKRLRKSDAFDLMARARLHDEAVLCADLDHPNVVPVLDFDENSAGDVRIVMMYMDGVDLDALIESGPLPVSVIEYIVGSVLSGLAYVHRRGIIHRDISLGNILISRAGAVRISDFGLAVRSEDGAPVAAPSGGGTMGFASPEAIRKKPVDARADLFSLGAVLYQLLTRKPAFPGRDAQERMAHTLLRPPTPPHALCPEVPIELSNMTMRLLALDPADRYASALEALDALPPSKYGSEDLAALLEERHRQGTLTLHRARHAPSDRPSSDDADSWSEIAKRQTERHNLDPLYGAALAYAGTALAYPGADLGYPGAAALDSAVLTRALVEADAIPRYVSQDVDVSGRVSELMADVSQGNEASAANSEENNASEASAANNKENNAGEASAANNEENNEENNASEANDTNAANGTRVEDKPSQPPRRTRPREWRGAYVVAAAAALIVAVIVGQRASRTMQPGHPPAPEPAEPVARPGPAPDHRVDPTPAEVAAPVSSLQPAPNADRDIGTTGPASTSRKSRARSMKRDVHTNRPGARTATDTPGPRAKAEPGIRANTDKTPAASDRATDDVAPVDPFERFAGPMGDTLPGEVVITP